VLDQELFLAENQGHIAEKRGSHEKYFALFFAFFRFLRILSIASRCLSTTSGAQDPPKKSCLKSDGRFNGCAAMCHNGGMKVEMTGPYETSGSACVSHAVVGVPPNTPIYRFCFCTVHFVRNAEAANLAGDILGLPAPWPFGVGSSRCDERTARRAIPT
jgi:hypothetical protein